MSMNCGLGLSWWGGGGGSTSLSIFNNDIEFQSALFYKDYTLS